MPEHLNLPTCADYDAHLAQAGRDLGRAIVRAGRSLAEDPRFMQALRTIGSAPYAADADALRNGNSARNNRPANGPIGGGMTYA